jgi:RNA polymerase sigma factor for flagellar operon FliA
MEDVWAEFFKTHRHDLRQELIEAYMPLVRIVVGRLGVPTTSVMGLDDMLSYGTIGLITAIDRFEPGHGASFETFASLRIRGAVIDQLRTLNWLPRSAMSRVRQIETALGDLEQQLGRVPQEEEVARAMGISVDRYRQQLQEAGLLLISLDAPAAVRLGAEDVATLGDLLEDPDTPDPSEVVERQEIAALLSRSLELLPPRERLLLALYYQEELTMKEISSVMSISESRVCQLHTQALLRLRTALGAKKDLASGRKGRSGQVLVHNHHTRQKAGTVS